jgi:glycosyltransferase involved in cell wall biosynthesis
MLSISVIIPTSNRAAALQRTVASIAKLHFPPADFEVLVVDNGSTDTTPAVFEAARAASPRHNWRYIYEPIPGLLSARHRGALESHGDICAFIDDDVRVEVDWLGAIGAAFRDRGVALVGGPSTPLFEGRPPEWLADFYIEEEHGRYCPPLSLFDGGKCVKEIHPLYVFGLNFSIRKEILRKVGGFHPDCIPKLLQRFQGDGETGVSLALHANGSKSVYHPGVAVQHEIPRSRLDMEFFAQRAFYQGVADSYTCIRAKGTAEPRWRTFSRCSARQLAARIRRRSSARSEILYRTRRSYYDGYCFHQREVSRDSALLAWVLRPDYWDYSLPAGWETYATGDDGRQTKRVPIDRH